MCFAIVGILRNLGCVLGRGQGVCGGCVDIRLDALPSLSTHRLGRVVPADRTEYESEVLRLKITIVVKVQSLKYITEPEIQRRLQYGYAASMLFAFVETATFHLLSCFRSGTHGTREFSTAEHLVSEPNSRCCCGVSASVSFERGCAPNSAKAAWPTTLALRFRRFLSSIPRAAIVYKGVVDYRQRRSCRNASQHH